MKFICKSKSKKTTKTLVFISLLLHRESTHKELICRAKKNTLTNIAREITIKHQKNKTKHNTEFYASM